ncbi:MAG: hypothetical protein U5N53_09015 [Mycobacterium sp.]|nr:hypothetical protein [Mycobacterium sp.]
MQDEMQAVLDGTNPDDVLVRVRTAEGVSYAVRKNYGRPIDFLRHQARKPITDAMLLAAEFYIADYFAMSQTGSNTQATIDHLMKAVPMTSEDRRMLDQEGINGGRMHSKAECHEASDPSDRMLNAAFALKRVDDRLDKVQRAILRDLLINEHSVGVIALRWRWPPEAAGVMVRYALLKLVEVYESLREDFAAWIRQERQSEVDAEQGL